MRFGPRHGPMVRPGIRPASFSTISNGVLSFANAKPGDWVHYSLYRTLASAPALVTGWAELLPAWSIAAPWYVINWWRFIEEGDSDPLPAENGLKRLRIFHGAKLKAGSVSAPSVSATSVTACSIPAAAPIKDVLREWGVYNIACRTAQANFAPYLPAGTIKRAGTTGVVSNDATGDTGGLNTGWPLFSFTLTAASAFHAFSYILEPKNS